MLALVSRVPGRLIRTAAPARRFAGHGHGDGKYTFDRASPNTLSFCARAAFAAHAGAFVGMVRGRGGG